MGNEKCECGLPWLVSLGPGRVVGPIANSILGVSAPLPDDFEYEYCEGCNKRNLTPELEKRLLEVERKYLKELREKPKEVMKKTEKLRKGMGGIGFSTGEVDRHGEIELQLNVDGAEGSCWLSKEMWTAIGEKAGFIRPWHDAREDPPEISEDEKAPSPLALTATWVGTTDGAKFWDYRVGWYDGLDKWSWYDREGERFQPDCWRELDAPKI